jgi:hypothetical protein
MLIDLLIRLAVGSYPVLSRYVPGKPASHVAGSCPGVIFILAKLAFNDSYRIDLQIQPSQA